MSLVKPIFGSQIDKNHHLSKGLIAYWLFNEGAGNKCYNSADICHLEHLPNAPIWIPEGLSFSGGNKYATCQHTPRLDFGTGDFSITIRLRTTSNANQYVFGKNYGGGTAKWWSVNVDARRVVFMMDDGQLSRYSNSNILFSDNSWHTITATRSKNGDLLIYADSNYNVGVLDTQTRSCDNAGIVVVGGRSDFDSTRQFYGDLSFVIVHNHELSPIEIEELHKNPYQMIKPKRALQFVLSGGGTVYEETVTISRSSSILSGVNAMFNASIDLSKSIECDSGGIGNFNDLISLGKSNANEYSATSVLQAVLTIDKLLSVLESSQATTDAVVILAAIKQVSTTNGSNYDVELSLSKSLDSSANSTGNYQTDVALSTIKSIISSANSAASASISVEKDLSIDLISQAIGLAALNIGYSVLIESGATDSTIVIRTPAERTIKILFENRIIKVPYENRTIKIK